MDTGGGGADQLVLDSIYFRLYRDGRVERAAVAEETTPAGVDPATGVASKDVVIDAATGTAARLFLPPVAAAASSPAAAASKLPVLVFFHGGYFIVGSPTHPLFHRYACTLAAGARALVVSVRYRLAPEHALPAAYDDAAAALAWVASGADPWLAGHGDLARVYLFGVSAGANIVHNVAVAAPPPAAARVEGVVLLHPSFASERRAEDGDEGFWRANRDRWAVIFPGADGGLDDPRINPMAAGAPSLATLAGRRMLVATASEDPRAPRGRAYRDAVRASGWRGEVEWLESPGEHVFFIGDQGSREAAKLMDRVVAFIAGH